MKPIVILSGPIGAGKSAVAKELIACSKGAVAYIEGDRFWSFLVKSEKDQGFGKNFRTIMKSMTVAAVPIALDGYEVILDFSIPPKFLDTARAVVKIRDVPLDYVVLRPSEGVCAERAAARAEGKIEDYTVYHDFYLSFGEAERYTISDDTSDAAVVAKRIRDGLDAGRFRVS